MKRSEEEELDFNPDTYEPTREEKLFYQMIWGKVWEEEYPSIPKDGGNGKRSPG